ncbi:MAG: hypothetical protein QME05_06610 [Candidatus Margulisbacteria bacterium]|nr:hypothetical protein [Candidatus Margulisiibacteriota bacterium]
MPIITSITGLAIHEVHFGRFPAIKVRTAWDAACKFWGIFGFTAPRVNRSIRDGGGIHDTNLAYLQFAEKRVTANLHRLEQAGLLDLLPAVFIHELGHKFIPGDLKTLLLIDHSVQQVIADQKAAHHIGSLFMDMVINTDAHRRGDKEIPQLYSRMWKKQTDPVIQILGRAYERLFQSQDTSRVYADSIIPASLAPDLLIAADKIVEIIRASRRHNWLEKARAFAEVLLPYIPKMDASVIYVISDTRPEDFSPPGKNPIPPKGKANRRDLEKRLGGVVYDLGKDKKPCDVGQFINFLHDCQINLPPDEVLIWFYRDLIGGKVIKVPEVSVASGSLYPFAPATWRPSDPPHQLDISLSLSTGGVLLPGITTKKWQFKGGEHLSMGKDCPGCDLWIDCSGSMPDPAKVVSQPVAAAMIIAKSFLETGKAVRAIAWSGTQAGAPKFESTAGFTRDEDEIDRVLINHQAKGWTVLPVAEFEAPYFVSGKEKYIVMITDLGIQNLEEGVLKRLRAIYEKSVGGTIFLIGDSSQTIAAQASLREIGFAVVPIDDIAQLEQHALVLTRRLFEARLEA